MEIITFFKILIFGGATAIADTGVKLSETPITLRPDEPLEVLTQGASLRINITSQIEIDEVDFFELGDRVNEMFPSGCVTASMAGSKTVELSHSSLSRSQTAVFLVLGGFIPDSSGTSFVSLFEGGEKFDTVSITSCKEFVAGEIYWLNYRK